jgi:hypothetical protein
VVQKNRRLTRTVVALGVAAATLTGCSAVDEATVLTAEEVAQQKRESDRKDGDRKGEARKQANRKKQAPARSSATSADLDAYVAAGEEYLDEMFGGSFEKLYSEIDLVPVYPNGIEYDYTFRTAVDPAGAKTQLDAQAPTLRTQARTMVIPEMERMGFAEPSVTYTYRNPDGSVVWTRSFS